MENKYWYVEISGTPEGMVNVEKYCTDSLLRSYVDVNGILHKRMRIASTFSLDSIECKNMLFDYMEENGGLDKYGASLVTNTKGVNWVGNGYRDYNLMYGKNGKLAAVYTDSKNINSLLNLRQNKGRLSNNKKAIPTSKVEYGIKKCIKSIVKVNKAIKNANTSKSLQDINA